MTPQTALANGVPGETTGHGHSALLSPEPAMPSMREARLDIDDVASCDLVERFSSAKLFRTVMAYPWPDIQTNEFLRRCDDALGRGRRAAGRSMLT